MERGIPTGMQTRPRGRLRDGDEACGYPRCIQSIQFNSRGAFVPIYVTRLQ